MTRRACEASSFTIRFRNAPTVSNSVENSKRDITIRSTSVSVETVADDMLAVSRSRSPNQSPDPMTVSARPSRLTRAEPDATIRNSRPGVPSRTTTLPARLWAGVEARATSLSSFCEHASKGRSREREAR
jgi:hypothetical protein